MVPPILDGVLNQGENVHIQVAYSSLLFLGELNEWFSQHEAYLPTVLTFIIHRLGKPDLATVAAKVLFPINFTIFLIYKQLYNNSYQVKKVECAILNLLSSYTVQN